MFDVFSMSKASVNWTAPEIFAPGDRTFRPTFASDVYGLGMLIYEVTRSRLRLPSTDPRLPPIGTQWTFPILQARQVRVGLPSRSGEQATASPARLGEIGNHGLGVGHDGNLLGQEGFRKTAD